MQALSGARPAANGERVMNIVHACENLADHLTHFYLFLPQTWPTPTTPTSPGMPTGGAVGQRRPGGAAMAGGARHPVRIVGLYWPGAGRTPWRCKSRRRHLHGGRRRAAALIGLAGRSAPLCRNHPVGLPIDAMLAIDHPDQLERLRAAGGDSGRWLRAADALGFAQLGRAHDHFWRLPPTAATANIPWPAGVWRDGAAQALNLRRIQEDVSHSWYENAPPAIRPKATPAPTRTSTRLQLEQSPAHRRPARRNRRAGAPTAGRTRLLARALVAAHGGSVLTRVLARQFEAAWLLAAIERWLRELDLAAPFIAAAPHDAVDGCAAGLTEAARRAGALGHGGTWPDHPLPDHRPHQLNFAARRPRHARPAGNRAARRGRPRTERAARGALV